MLVPGNAEGKSAPVPARHRDQSSPEQVGVLRAKATQYWKSTGPERSSANQLHRVRASRGEYLSDARPWQCRRQKRSCTCEAQGPEQSRTGWGAQGKSDSVLAKHETRAVQCEPPAQSESEVRNAPLCPPHGLQMRSHPFSVEGRSSKLYRNASLCPPHG